MASAGQSAVRQVWTISGFGSTWSIVPVSIPPKARKGVPGRDSLVAEAPVKAA